MPLKAANQPENNESADEPDVWKYLGESSSNPELKRKSRREKARKFLKMTQSTRSQVTQSCQRFKVTDIVEKISLENITLPPSEDGTRLPGQALSHSDMTTRSYHVPGPPNVVLHPPLPSPPPPVALPPLPSEPPQHDDLHFRQDTQPRDKKTDSNSHFGNEKNTTSAPPQNRLQAVRQWTTNSPYSAQNDRNAMRIRYLSYNVLAQNLLESNPQLYRGIETVYLAWRNRWRDIQREVTDYNPDIVSLQEVQFRRPNMFRSDYLPFFEAQGYRAIFKSRTGDKQDGCAIFYKILKFKLDKYSLVEYSRQGVPVLNRDNVGIVCRLIPRGKNDLPAFVVGTTHLLFNPKREDVRLAQMAVFLAELEKLSFVDGGSLPVIMSGDFNCSTSSQVYKLVLTGRSDYGQSSHAKLRSISRLLPRSVGVTDTCQWETLLRERHLADAVVYETGGLSHGFRFESIHAEWEHPSVARGDQVVSTNHGDWTIVDFVFFSGGADQCLRLVSRLRLPTHRQMAHIGRIPSDVCPSDHFPLVADFLLTKCDNRTEPVMPTTH